MSRKPPSAPVAGRAPQAPSAAAMQERLQHAIGLHRGGRLAEAGDVYRQLLAAAPRHPDLLNLLGLVEFQSERAQEALRLFDRALAARQQPEFLNNRGLAQSKLGRADAAIVSFRRALALRPDYVEALCNLGNELRRQGRLDDARDELARCVELFPASAEAHNSLGVVLAELHRHDAAVQAYGESIARRPGYAEAHYNLGNSLRALGRHRDAAASLRRAIELRPRYAEACNNLGSVLQELGDLDAAAAQFEQAVALHRAAGASTAGLVSALVNLGIASYMRGDLERSIELYRQALQEDPGHLQARSNLLLALHYDAALPAAELAAEHRQYGAAIAAAGIRPASRHRRSVDAGRRLNVGYVSPDFRLHSCAYFFEPLLAAHDRGAVRVVCYSNAKKADAVTARLAGLADDWRDIHELDDDAAAQRIEADGIDILVDLAGHTAGCRLPLFARKPAPVQLAWLGYPDTTGLAAVDYRLTDAIADPIGDGDELYSERLVRLPACFLCYRPPEDAPAVAPAEARPVVFGSFNNIFKAGASVIELWAGLLHAVPESRLLLKSEQLRHESPRRRLLAAFAGHGIGAERLELRSWSAQPGEHLAAYADIDVGLDTFPYNGTTTTCEALHMGVPVITLSGDRHVSRVGASLLSAAGLADLIAASRAEYLDKAVALANDPARRAALRANLRTRLAASALCHADRFAAAVEAAYRRMWLTWCGMAR